MTLTMLGRTIPALALAAALAGCSGSGEPAVGKCTNADPNLGVELSVEIVGCDDDDATTKIVKEVADGVKECDSGRLKFEDKTFCTEPLKK